MQIGKESPAPHKFNLPFKRQPDISPITMDHPLNTSDKPILDYRETVEEFFPFFSQTNTPQNPVAQDTSHFTFKKPRQVPELRQIYQANAIDSEYSVSPSHINNKSQKKRLSSGKQQDMNAENQHNAYEHSGYHPKSDQQSFLSYLNRPLNYSPRDYPSPTNHTIKSPEKYSSSFGIGQLETSMNNSRNYSGANSKLSTSRAYVNAMKALQDKIKGLEDKIKNIVSEQEYGRDSERVEFEKAQMQFQSELNSYRTAETILKDKIGLIERQTNDMSSFIQRLEREKENVNKTSKELETERNSLQKQVTTLEHEKLIIQTELSTSQLKVQELTNELQHYQKGERAAQENWEKTIADLKYEKESLNQTNQTVSERLKKLDKDHQEYKRVYNEHLHELMIKNESLTSELGSIKGFYTQQINDFQKELDIIEESHQKKLSEVEQYAETLKKRNTELQELFDLKSKEADSLKAKLDEYIKNAQHLGIENQVMPNLQQAGLLSGGPSIHMTSFSPMSHQQPIYPTNAQGPRYTSSPINNPNNRTSQKLARIVGMRGSMDPLLDENLTSAVTSVQYPVNSSNTNILNDPKISSFDQSDHKLTHTRTSPNNNKGTVSNMHTTNVTPSNYDNFDHLDRSPKNLLTDNSTTRKNMLRNAGIINPADSKNMRPQTPIIKDLNSEIEKYLYSGGGDGSPNQEPSMQEPTSAMNFKQYASNNSKFVEMLNSPGSDDRLLSMHQGHGNGALNPLATFNANANTLGNSGGSTGSGRKGLMMDNAAMMTRNLSFGKSDMLSNGKVNLADIRTPSMRQHLQMEENAMYNNNNIDNNTQYSNGDPNQVRVKSFMEYTENQEYVAILEKIENLQEQMNRANREYQLLVQKSQEVQDSKERSVIRSNLIMLTETLQQMGEQLFNLKKREQAINQARGNIYS